MKPQRSGSIVTVLHPPQEQRGEACHSHNAALRVWMELSLLPSHSASELRPLRDHSQLRSAGFGWIQILFRGTVAQNVLLSRNELLREFR
jgi:hypothetical protein